MRTAQIPPDEFQRMQAILTDPAVINFFAAGFTDTENSRVMALKAILTADPLTHYVRGLDSWQDYLQQRSKHYPIRERVRHNFNSANDEEIKR